MRRLRNAQTDTDPGSPLIPAAAYVRMSTEHQRYSADNQIQALEQYAERRGYVIVRTYADLGKSGLSIDGRTGLQALLRDAADGSAPFKALLVYDVSRWGRFQDPDEAASYELICRRAGLSVHYCAEQFENDGTMMSSILKALKRVMAAEYSRDLSAKVYAGQANMVRRGFRLGGRAGYGYRRLLVDQNLRPRGIMEDGERKACITDRTMLVRGPESEIRTIRRIYRLFTKEAATPYQIARLLNREALDSGTRERWTKKLVIRLLTSEKYIGNSVWGRKSGKLRTVARPTPPEAWVRCDGAFPKLVPTIWFKQAQAIFARNRRRYLSDEEILERLRELVRETGEISSLKINRAGLGFGVGTVKARFGSIRETYRLLGHVSQVDFERVDAHNTMRLREQTLRTEIAKLFMLEGHETSIQPRAGLVCVTGGPKLLVKISDPWRVPSRAPRWRWRNLHSERPQFDYLVLLRLEPETAEVLDYFFIPASEMPPGELRLGGKNNLHLARYSRPSLDLLVEMTMQGMMSTLPDLSVSKRVRG